MAQDRTELRRWIRLCEDIDTPRAVADLAKMTVKHRHDNKFAIDRYTIRIPVGYDAELEAYVIVDGDTMDFNALTVIGAKNTLQCLITAAQ